MTLQEFWLPYLVSQIIFILLLIASWRWFKGARIFWMLIFLAAGLFNLYTALTDPQVYTMYAPGVWLPLYRTFIDGEFARHPQWYVIPIALGQLCISILLTQKTPLFRLGCLGGIIFLLAISPLGIGSAFPATVIGALGLVLLWRHGAEQLIWQKSTNK